MFGKNPIRKQVIGNGLTLDVFKIFETIQGEGPFAGMPCTFVRLHGCNLACTFCDTDFESQVTAMGIHEIAAKCIGKYKLVVITGGEPFRQNIIPLIYCLNNAGVRVQIETAGTLTLPDLDKAFKTYEYIKAYGIGLSNIIVCSPKTPKINEEIEPFVHYFKYIVSTQGAYATNDWIASGRPPYSTQKLNVQQFLAKPPIWMDPIDVFVSPCDENGPGVSESESLARNADNLRLAARVAMEVGYRLSVQMHKLVGLE